MRKSFWFRGKWLRLAIISGLGLVCTTAVFAADASRTSFSALADSAVTRAEAEVTKVKLLVDQGALPHKRLDETQSALEDAKDEALLGRTLYGQLRVEALTPEQAKDMVAAAQRRVERQTKAVGERTKLLESGVLARSEMQPFEDELSMRQRTLELAENRAKLLEELMAMAKSEQALEQQSLSEPPSSQAVMIKFNGNGLFPIEDLKIIGAAYVKKFDEALPISALGQTMVHQELGFDHRGRVDVALNPDSQKGLWLRSFLEKLHIPYIGFRAAVAGSATAPHIHIGPGSTRLKLAQEPLPAPVTAPARVVRTARNHARVASHTPGA